MSIDRNIKEAGFIIPAIDIIDGKAVRLTQGDYSKLTVYHKYPLDATKYLKDAFVYKFLDEVIHIQTR